MAEYIRSVLGSNLKNLRNRRQWSQMELAEKANISVNFLSEIERGLKWPYPETLQNLASTLGVEVFELFKPEDRKTPAIEEYTKRFLNDVVMAVEKSVKRSLAMVKRQYRV